MSIRHGAAPRHTRHQWQDCLRSVVTSSALLRWSSPVVVSEKHVEQNIIVYEDFMSSPHWDYRPRSEIPMMTDAV
ncbi:hypothetical protein J6590_009123 [Homalodisca vitripennis]|nr:hypothetical protein J6590_009123 [Homalodisca vitripennis]